MEEDEDFMPTNLDKSVFNKVLLCVVIFAFTSVIVLASYGSRNGTEKSIGNFRDSVRSVGHQGQKVDVRKDIPTGDAEGHKP